MENKETYTGILTISLTILTIFIAFLTQAMIMGNPFMSPFYLVSILTLFGLGFILLLYGYRNFIKSLIWQFSYIARVKQKKIGILSEEGCPSSATSFSSGHWFNLFSGMSNPEYLRFIAINDEFSAIINPYGEYYQEEDYITFYTFNRILKYVENGGIFVTTGGLAFMWAWRTDSDRPTMTSEEITGYLEATNPYNFPPQNFLIPSIMIHTHSLKDTLLYKTFKILTTVNGPLRLHVTQAQQDIDFCGDILTGQINQVFEFRAVREPIPKCIPMLRAQVNITGNQIENVYPLVAIPHGKGLFVLAGMAFDFQNQNSIVHGHPNIARSQCIKIRNAVINLIVSSKLIELDRKRIKSFFYLHKRPIKLLNLIKFLSKLFS